MVRGASDKLGMADLLDRSRATRGLGAALSDRAPTRLRRRRRANFGRPPRSVYKPFMTRRKKRRGGQENACVLGRFAQITVLPNTHVPVVVCRSAGIWTRGQSTVLRKDRQPEANRRTPPNGGRDLKQRRTGLFRLCRPSKGRLTEEACLSCRVCGRVFPLQTMAVSLADGASLRRKHGYGAASDPRGVGLGGSPPLKAKSRVVAVAGQR